MMFCSICSNLLIIEKIDGQSNLSCKACPFVHKITDTLAIKHTYTTKRVEVIIDKADEFKYASKCEKKCSKCGYNTAAFIEMQTRSADEPMTIFYQCINCKETWKE
ncbi:DNA-directed RNA polymerase III subunit RPC10 [Astathelohania contejeani]|uniref:DNA-directed RNA polymerase subunit n=1 Tax=Astathelohania contejeani TaxID=164912 RepID=A0ABQ7I231_9MICR|nr:DNA-directed RNA polymerase III subunit RPC10 [Thelohania contejeani]